MSSTRGESPPSTRRRKVSREIVLANCGVFEVFDAWILLMAEFGELWVVTVFLSVVEFSSEEGLRFSSGESVFRWHSCTLSSCPVRPTIHAATDATQFRSNHSTASFQSRCRCSSVSSSVSSSSDFRPSRSAESAAMASWAETCRDYQREMVPVLQ